MSEYRATLPPGWPKAIKGPGETDWEATAYRWLIDQAPGAWRDGRNGHQYREHPLMLARDLRYLLDGYIDALRRAYSRARVELPAYAHRSEPRGDRGTWHADLAVTFQPQQIEEVLDMYRTEGPRLLALVQQVGIVEDALSGVRWVPRKADADWSKLE